MAREMRARAKGKTDAGSTEGAEFAEKSGRNPRPRHTLRAWGTLQFKVLSCKFRKRKQSGRGGEARVSRNV